MNDSPFTRLVIRGEYVKHNIEIIRSRIPEQTRLYAVVKNNAYGHGLTQFSGLCYDCGLRHFAVYHPQSALKLLEALPGDCEYLVLGYPAKDELPSLFRHEVQLTVNSPSCFDEMEHTARECGHPAKIHLELETGMHRTGLTFENAERLMERTEASPHVIITGLYSHLSGDPVPENLSRVRQQISRFTKFSQKITPAAHLDLHLSNSFGIALQSGTTYEFVRPGISLYGFWSSRAVKSQLVDEEYTTGKNQLMPVMRWESSLMDIRRVHKGNFIGYGRHYQTEEDSTIGIVPVGYGDGFPKQLEDGGRVLIGETLVPLVGSINMNLLQVDLSGLEGIPRGERVILMSDAGGPEDIRANVLSDQSGRYLYEFLANISPFMHREIE